MEHVLLHFEHGVEDIIPFCNAVQQIRQLLSCTGDGEYIEDDMAIDGGDAEVILRGPSADTLYATILPTLRKLSVMREARVTLVYGSVGSGAPEKIIELET